jgi:hypothetical protein
MEYLFGRIGDRVVRLGQPRGLPHGADDQERCEHGLAEACVDCAQIYVRKLGSKFRKKSFRLKFGEDKTENVRVSLTM